MTQPATIVSPADFATPGVDIGRIQLRRITKKWEELGLEPITFQDSRHTAATWLRSRWRLTEGRLGDHGPQGAEASRAPRRRADAAAAA
jgi:integrase